MGLFCALKDFFFSSILGLYPQDSGSTVPHLHSNSGLCQISPEWGRWGEPRALMECHGEFLEMGLHVHLLMEAKFGNLTHNLTCVDTALLSGLKARIKIKYLPIP